ncbi:hypothetical protein BV210_05135 [Halorientalis sp. IM1011]|uniref:hypothetical protein n=1 Tax=Halorientalis sp. IM1011 TaxID=1932360 RepID=UPI00097CD2A0|nr:hypothetical protein [Halorientalis sp. IM1011]AQL42132.1 hypothetical protein BV210_05135 [Halorientalis sp. IM1011]
MDRDDALATRRAKIDARIETALDATDEDGLAVARETVDAAEDRWYGQLVLATYDATVERRDTSVILPAAAALELLQGYCRLRGELLVQLTERGAHSLTHDPTEALLAADYLYTAAYSTLGSAEHPRIHEGFETLTEILESITGAFATTYAGSSRPVEPRFFEETAGSLGEGAAVVGATLAGVDDARRERFRAFGRGASTARRIDRALDPERNWSILPASLAEDTLEDHATTCRAVTERSLDELTSTTDPTALQALLDRERAGGQSPSVRDCFAE